MRFSKTQIGLFVALLLGNAILLYGNLDWLWLRLPAAVALTFVLPGWAWLPLFGWLQPADAIERVVLVVGMSSLLSALALLITVLLPGPFTETPVLVALNLVILAGLASQSFVIPRASRSFVTPKWIWPSRKVLLILLAILAVAAFTRLTRLSYGEFHEDELENMRLIVRAYKGEAYAPFLDSKGPIHWLLPAALWYLNGWLTEGIARAPFAITSLALIPTAYVLGRRMFGRNSVGLLAAGFVAVNGFFVAYARFVENQSLIVFWGALAMWLGYRYVNESAPQFLGWIALALAVGLVAHPDVLLYLPVFGFILWLKRELWRQQWRWWLGAAALFVVVNAIFYVPYFTDPNITAVRQYFAQERIGESLLYNQVANLFDQDQLYSSRYHAPVLVLLLAWLLSRHFARQGWPGWIIWLGLAAAIISTVVWPQLWIIGALNLAFTPYALLTLAVLLLPQTGPEIKLLFLWLAAPLGALLFLAKDAADHVQIAYTAWALLAALALVDIWDLLSAPAAQEAGLPARLKLSLKAGLALLLALAAILTLAYQYLAFLSLTTTYWQVKADYTYNSNSIYGRLYGSIPRPRKIFSNPRLGGWKAVGYLWETGLLSGDFRSVNESFAVPIWYTFQTPRSCYTDPQHYWLQRDWEGWPEEEQEILAQGYTLTRVVLVDQQPKLRLYQKNASAAAPEIIDLETYRHQFDRLATPARFAQAEDIARPASLNFGDKLLLRGFDLPDTGLAGQLLPVTLYWETLAPMDSRYRAFVHLVDANGNRLAQHDDDPACRLLTTDMRPGQESTRQFRLPLPADILPGHYSVLFGVYHPDTLARLPIWDNQSQQSPGDSVILGDVWIEQD